MFSIIIPLYNKAPYIEKALRSVLFQTYKEFEIIVMDDGSKDNSYEIAKSVLLETSNYKLQTQPNQGVSTARNNAVKLAKYPYICFLDADDWWAPTFLEEIKALIEQFPNAGIYGSGYYIVKNGINREAPIGVDINFERGEINYCQVYAKTLCMPLWTGAVCLSKKNFEEEEGFKPKLKLGEDFDLWIRIAMKYPVVFLNKPLAYYNQDVEIKNRAVSKKLYLPQEHMLFSNYGEWMDNDDFRFLFERLALYSLLPYYLNNLNEKETKKIFESIDFKKHESKYYWYYKKIPKNVLEIYFFIMRYASLIKQIILKNFNLKRKA